MCTKIRIIYFLICLQVAKSQEILKEHKGRYMDNDYHSLAIIYRNYIENMLNIIDWNIKPCDDFFQHACGYFQTATCAKTTNPHIPLSPSITDSRYGNENCQLPPYLYNHQDRFQFFIQSKDAFRTKHGQIIRNLYNLCTRLNHGKSKIYKFHILLHQMEFFHKHRQCLVHKWPFMPNEGHKCVRKLIRNWLTAAAELAANGLQTFVTVFFADKTIYITANKQLQCWNRNELYTYIRKILKRSNTSNIKLIANELWTFCQQLKNATLNHWDSTEDDFLKCHLANATQYQTNDFLEEDLWLDYMSHYLQRLEFTEREITNAQKVIRHNQYLRQIAHLLKCTNPRIIYNFLIWQMLKEFNINDCYNLIVENFERSLFIEYWSWNVFQMYFQRDRILTSYIFYITMFRQQVQLYQKTNQWHSPLLSGSLPRVQHDDLQLIEALQLYAEEHLANTNFLYNPQSSDINAKDVEFKENLLIHSKQFYKLLLTLKRYQIRSNFYKTPNDIDDIDDNMKDVIDADNGNLFYNNLLKEFIWFTILLTNRPLVHFYATQNREMWSHSEILYTTDGLYTSVDCLLQQTNIETDYNVPFKEMPEQQMLEVYKFYKVFAATKRDYEFWLDGEIFAISEEFILEYYQMSTNHIMFYAVAQQYCGRNDNHFSYLINRSYMNYPDFDNIFNCTDHNDAMIPLHKCSLDL